MNPPLATKPQTIHHDDDIEWPLILFEGLDDVDIEAYQRGGAGRVEDFLDDAASRGIYDIYLDFRKFWILTPFYHLLL